MYKVFIVEDERIVREGLRDNIPWEQYGYRFVGEAGDGEMALPLIREHKPDVLITDIRMPFMDGLSLCRIVKAELPDIRIVILSGYDDFEYARKAIEIGVDQYLTKPVTRRAMTKALDELARKMEAEKEKENYLTHYRMERHEYELFLQRRFFEDVFAGKLSVETIYQEAGRLGLDLSGSAYRLLLIDLFSTQDTPDAEQLEICREDAARYFLRHPQYLLIRWVNNTFCILIHSDRETVTAYTERAQLRIREICAMYGEDKDYFICISRITDRFSNLKDCYREVSRYFSRRYLPGREHVLSADNFRETEAAPPAEAMPEGADELEGERSHILENALSYIDSHFTDEQISLNTAAASAGISPGYFSALFSQKMGMTFIEYLTARRMEKAKELLGASGQSSAQVAAAVGYRDPNYFRYVFKKTEGCTPREYRMAHTVKKGRGV